MNENLERTFRKTKWAIAVLLVASASPAMTQAYCSDGSATCPSAPSAPTQPSPTSKPIPAPSNNGTAPNTYCADGSANCSNGPSGNTGNGAAGCGNNGCNAGTPYRPDGSAGNPSGCGNNGCAPSNNGTGWVSSTSSGDYNPDGSAAPSSTCGNNGCGFAGNALPQATDNEMPAPQPSNNGLSPSLAPPVQIGTTNDTIGAGQPAQAVGGPGTVRAAQPVAQTTNIPRVPFGLYPTNQGDLAQPIPLGWSAVVGATRYRVAVRDQATGAFPVNDIYVSTNTLTVSSLPAGHTFTWDVAACNAAGCSERSGNGQFRTGGGAVSASTRALTYDDVLTSNEKIWFFPYFDYLKALPNGQTVTTFSPSMIREMKSSNRWMNWVTGAMNDIRSFDYCGSKFTQFWIPDNAGRANISQACRVHDSCYASNTSRLTCDTSVSNEIMSSCTQQGESRARCATASSMFFVGLRVFGGCFRKGGIPVLKCLDQWRE